MGTGGSQQRELLTVWDFLFTYAYNLVNSFSGYFLLLKKLKWQNLYIYFIAMASFSLSS